MARLLWLLAVGLLQACAGTPVAEQLERSFAVPEDRPVQVMPVPVAEPSPKIVSPTIDQPAEPEPEAVSLPEAEDPEDPLPEDPLPQEPYRITIRLAGADPAAPAEAVTRALREADVGFAVERIERVEP